MYQICSSVPDGNYNTCELTRKQLPPIIDIVVPSPTNVTIVKILEIKFYLSEFT